MKIGLCCFLTSFLLLSAGADADRIVRVGVYDNAPIVFQDAEGRYRGLSVELLEYIAKQEGWRLEYVPGTWAECLERLEKGENDVQVYIAYSKKRARKYDFTEVTLMHNWGQVYTRREAALSSIFDLEGKKVAVLKKGIHAVFFKDLVGKFGIHAEIIELDSHDDVFRYIENNQADAGITNRVFGLAHACKHRVSRTPVVFNPIEIRHAVPKGKNRDIRLAIDTHLAGLKKDKDSVYYDLFHKAFPTPLPKSVPVWLWWTLTGIIVLAGMITLVAFFFRYQVRKKTTELRETNARLQQESTDRKQLEEKLNRFFSLSLDLLCIADLEGRFCYINPAVEKTLGWSREELLSKPYIEFVHPDDRNSTSVASVRLTEGIPAIRFENRYFCKDGTYRWLSWMSQPDTSAGLTYGVARDVTDEKKALEERKELEERLRQSYKMEAIGTLAGGIAHDFNNILAAIFGYAELAYEDMPKQSSARYHIEALLKASDRAKDLVKHILSFSRKSDQERKPVEIHLIVKEVIKLLRASIPTTIDIRQQINPDCGAILSDPTQIHQILMNLCTNAAQAMDENGGILEVGLENITLRTEDLINEPGLRPGPFVRLTVKDTGPGIAPDIIDRIFDPYFTTKEVGQGSGMGLAVVHGIVKNHGGMITVESAPGEGAVFRIFFPKIETDAEPEAEGTEPLPTGNERILLVDDEEALVNMTRQRLARLGYQVTATTSSTEALAMFRSHQDAFDLILTDQTMPHMTGLELVGEAMAIRPDIPVVLCTGYSSKVDADQAWAAGIRAFAMKPLDKGTLAKLVRKVLDEDRGCGTR